MRVNIVKLLNVAIFVGMSLFPMVTDAQPAGRGSSLNVGFFGPQTLIDKINVFIVNPLLGLLFVLAALIFFWGLFQFIANAENEDGRSAGKRHLLWGTVGMLIVFSVAGIINLLIRTVNTL